MTYSYVFSIACILSWGSLLQADNKTEESPGKEIVADFRGVAKKAIPAVVSIKVEGKKSKENKEIAQESSSDFLDENLWDFFGLPHPITPESQLVEGQASGVIIKPEGYILTNSHVVHNMSSVTVQLNDGNEHIAKVLGDDPNSDLALIKIDAKDLPYLSLGNSDDLEIGQWVAAIGNPFGLQATLTVGVVSAKSRNNLDIARYEDFIQTDAAINQGNSGGPLITLDAKVIGINTAIATTTSSSYIGIGFAIPSNMAEHFMTAILSEGKFTRGFLGVQLQSINQKQAKSFGLKKVEGALIATVSKDSAAEKAGLQPKDVVLKINDRTVENAATLRNAIYMLTPGTSATLTILRQEKMMEIPITIGKEAL